MHEKCHEPPFFLGNVYLYLMSYFNFSGVYPIWRIYTSRECGEGWRGARVDVFFLGGVLVCVYSTYTKRCPAFPEKNVCVCVCVCVNVWERERVREREYDLVSYSVGCVCVPMCVCVIVCVCVCVCQCVCVCVCVCVYKNIRMWVRIGAPEGRREVGCGVYCCFYFLGVWYLVCVCWVGGHGCCN